MIYLRQKFHGVRLCLKQVWVSLHFRLLIKKERILFYFSLLEHEIILNRVILNRTTAVPTNYTIIYKYIRAELSGFISFIEFECKNCVSDIKCACTVVAPKKSLLFFSLIQTLTGNISKNANVGPRKENVVSATLDIQDGTDVEVWVRIYGVGASISSRLSVDPFTVEFLGDKLFEPKSFALVYAHNVTQKRHHLISLGERQPGDHLVKFDSKFIQRTSTNNFPESEFEYSQTDAYLTHISFSFDVSVCLSVLKNRWLPTA